MSTKEVIPGVPARDDWKNRSFNNYTDEELEWWVRLLTKRASHRVPGKKREKDLYDAGVYQAMLDDRRTHEQKQEGRT